MDIPTWLEDPFNLSKDDWLRFINDKDIFLPENKAILSFVYGCPEHKSTAYDIAEHFGISYQKAMSDNRQLSKRILNDLGVKPKANDNGGERFWNLAFTGSMPKQHDEKGHFYWMIRPELAAALETALNS
jgi:hypothetical protein